MNDRQEAKLSMYQEVAKICHANEQVYVGVPAMNSAVQRLDEGVAGILRRFSARTQSPKSLVAMVTQHFKKR
jgi:hypothetical protein